MFIDEICSVGKLTVKVADRDVQSCVYMLRFLSSFLEQFNLLTVCVAYTPSCFWCIC